MFNSLIDDPQEFSPSLYLGDWYDISDGGNIVINYSDTSVPKKHVHCTVKRYDDHWNHLQDKLSKIRIYNNELYVASHNHTTSTTPDGIVHATKYDEWSLVGDGNKITMLCRTPTMNTRAYITILDICKKLKYDVSNLEEEFNLMWNKALANNLAVHFCMPYGDIPSKIATFIGAQPYIVERPNHGLAFAVMQGYLTVDLIMYLINNSTSELATWVKQEVEKDPAFIYCLQLLSAYQRSGRASEVKSSENPQLYSEYINNDRLIFENDTPKYASLLNGADLSQYLLYPLKYESLHNIERILYLAHYSCLRRIPHFDKSIICENMLQITNDEKLINYLWDRSGIYLEATGDRDLEYDRKDYADRFYILSNDPVHLAETLYNC